MELKVLHHHTWFWTRAHAALQSFSLIGPQCEPSTNKPSGKGVH